MCKEIEVCQIDFKKASIDLIDYCVSAIVKIWVFSRAPRKLSAVGRSLVVPLYYFQSLEQ